MRKFYQALLLIASCAALMAQERDVVVAETGAVAVARRVRSACKSSVPSPVLDARAGSGSTNRSPPL